MPKNGSSSVKVLQGFSVQLTTSDKSKISKILGHMQISLNLPSQLSYSPIPSCRCIIATTTVLTREHVGVPGRDQIRHC
eukprot:2426931-Amphidinium_carterae.1